MAVDPVMAVNMPGLSTPLGSVPGVVFGVLAPVGLFPGAAAGPCGGGCGHSKRTQDALGKITTLLRDNLNRVTAEIDPLSRRTTHAYDANGNPITTKNPLG